MRKQRLGLRARVAVTFSVLGLVLSAGLALLTYQIARTYLIDQRQSLAFRQAFVDAEAAKKALNVANPDVASLLESLPSSSTSYPVLRVGELWFAGSVGVNRNVIPASLVRETAAGHAAHLRTHLDGQPVEIVGVPLGSGKTYFEVFSLDELDRTLRTLAWSLLAAASITTVVAVIAAAYTSGRVLRPVRRFADAASDIARGHLDTRLHAPGDADLEPVAASFNEMAAALQTRIERDERFASDVAHELRTPLSAISAAVEVLDHRADNDLRRPVDVLRAQVQHFEKLVLDLLEISSLDANAGEVVAERVDPEGLVRSVVTSLGHDDVAVRRAASTPQYVWVDKRRVERVLSNLIQNADRHASGPVEIVVSGSDDLLRIAVEDDGKGVPLAEREAIFERFHRGPSNNGAAQRGTGLGLALVAEHCRVHGGRAWVEDRAGGGSRFVVEFRSP